MPNRVYEITYLLNNQPARVILDYDMPDFSDQLRKVEQALADAHARDIVYLLRQATPEDIDEVKRGFNATNKS